MYISVKIDSASQYLIYIMRTHKMLNVQVYKRDKGTAF